MKLDKLKIDISVSKDINLNPSDLKTSSSEFTIDNHKKYMNISVKNTMNKNLNQKDINRKINEVFKNLNNIEVIKKYSHVEGGSGLYKLYTTLQYHIDGQYALYYNVSESGFEIGIILEADEIIDNQFRKESVDENTIN